MILHAPENYDPQILLVLSGVEDHRELQDPNKMADRMKVVGGQILDATGEAMKTTGEVLTSRKIELDAQKKRYNFQDLLSSRNKIQQKECNIKHYIFSLPRSFLPASKITARRSLYCQCKVQRRLLRLRTRPLLVPASPR